MTLSNETLVQAVSAFAATISQQPLGLAHHCPQDGAVADDCMGNVTAFLNEHDGAIRYGWCFYVRTVEDAGHFLVAANHAVWHNPQDGHLVNLTPYDPDPARQPVTHQGELLFLVDDDATPVESGDQYKMQPRKYFPIGDDASLLSYVAKLKDEEAAS